MTETYQGVVKGNTIVLDQVPQLPEGARVEVRVQAREPQRDQSGNQHEDPFEAVLRHRVAYAGRRVGIEDILEEEKQDREERFDH